MWSLTSPFYRCISEMLLMQNRCYWFEWSTCFSHSIFLFLCFSFPTSCSFPHFSFLPIYPHLLYVLSSLKLNFALPIQLPPILWISSVSLDRSQYHSWPKPVSSLSPGCLQHTTGQEAATDINLYKWAIWMGGGVSMVDREQYKSMKVTLRIHYLLGTTPGF